MKSPGGTPLLGSPTLDHRSGFARSGSLCLQRSWKIQHSVAPIPTPALALPKSCQQARLITVVRTPNHAAKQNNPGMILAGTKQLTCMPAKRGTVERHQNQIRLSATSQQCGIIKPQPHAFLPIGNMDDGEIGDEPPTGRN